MSLLKAYNTSVKTRYDDTSKKVDFLKVIESLTETPLKEDYTALLGIYASYAVEYLIKSAVTLEKDQKMQDTMQLMTSYVAEVGNKIGLKYYHKAKGYTIVDLVVQNVLDKGEVDYSYIEDAIDEIEDSYVEEEIDFDYESELDTDGETDGQ